MSPELRIGRCSSTPLTFSFERLSASLRLLLVNADESGSMEGRLHENLTAYKATAALLGGQASVVVLHGFASDSEFEVIVDPTARGRLGPPDALLKGLSGRAVEVRDAAGAVREGEALLAAHQTRGTTNPRSLPAFLTRLCDALDAYDGEVELVVLSSSDGGLDGGAQSPMTQQIQAAMRRLCARSRCWLAVNVLVGSAGSPDALSFFTGEPDRYENRLLFSTVAAGEGVLRLAGFDPASLRLQDGEGARYTVQPGLACWTVDGDRLLTWEPEGDLSGPAQVTVRRLESKAGGRQLVSRAEVRLARRDVTLDRDGREVFELISRSLSDNPYLRERSREALNALIAPLEALLGTRAAVVAMLAATPEANARVAAIEAQVAENTAAIRAVVAQEGLTPRERASRVNALNNARHLLKASLREASDARDQEALERELGFYEAHPNHWLCWLQPALDALSAQLGRVSADPGDRIAHLSTRIRTAKSAEDGRARAADRYLDRVLEESRARRDRRERRADPRDQEPFEQAAVWTGARCPVSGRPLTEGLAAIPFVADRSDLTSGNLMAGGQNVDRIPVPPGPMLSMSAVRELMWGQLGQMASPYLTEGGPCNAAIPVLLGSATPDAMRDLERAIGWLCTGTSAFGPQMAEAIPGALAVLLGAPDEAADRSPQVQALLRTSALLNRYFSYPYVRGTSAFDETAKKVPVTVAWAQSLDDAGGAACLQSLGCVTSLFARAVAAETLVPEVVADDLFSWACRNIARAILGADRADGSGGVEGVLRLAALLGCAVELEGAPLDAAALERPPEGGPAQVELSGSLDEAALAWVLGPARAELAQLQAPVPLADFTEALNAGLSALDAPGQLRVIESLDAIFARLDALAAPPGAPVPATRPRETVAVRAVTHPGFDLFSLDAVRPRRLSTPAPRLTSPLARIRRLTTAGETRWIPPADAGARWNPSALSWLEGHTALYPLRAFLRLLDAGLVGRPALAALRASPEVVPVPALPRVLPRMAELLGGLDKVMGSLRRAFAFVVANAGGYADNQWATSPLRLAGDEAVDRVLGPLPEPAAGAPRVYGANDVLDLRVDETWPRMDSQGFLPKSRPLDHEGRLRGPPVVLREEDLALSDLLLCQRAFAVMIAEVAPTETNPIIGGLHRCSRRVLGEHPVDLHTLEPEEQARVLEEEIAPRVAGRVRGDRLHPVFFQDILNVLHQMLALGVDTRTLRGEEPKELLAAEAAEIRARSGGAGGVDAV